MQRVAHIKLCFITHAGWPVRWLAIAATRVALHRMRDIVTLRRMDEPATVPDTDAPTVAADVPATAHDAGRAALTSPTLAEQLAARRAERAAGRRWRVQMLPSSAAPASEPDHEPDIPFTPLAPGELDAFLADQPGDVGAGARARLAAALPPEPEPIDADAGLPIRERALRMLGRQLPVLANIAANDRANASDRIAAIREMGKIADVYESGAMEGFVAGAGRALGMLAHALRQQAHDKAQSLVLDVPAQALGQGADAAPEGGEGENQ